jgi:enamine deaminase RidA (YjgF/YER057c/UK114 family)
MSDDVDARLKLLGIILPDPASPLGAYVPALIAGDMLYVSMQGPIQAGRPTHVGRIGDAIGIDAGRAAAEVATLNAVAQIRSALGGFDRLDCITRLEGCIACTEDFKDHATILDASSELLAKLFGDRAGHARSVCGVRNLPGNVPVAIVVTARLRSGQGH